MNNKKMACIDKEFEITARQMYPFARSLYQVTKMLNDKLKRELIGDLNGKFIKTQKR